jgi:hypothetical protein
MAVLGIYDPSQLNQGNISGKAINGQQQQADLSNFHFYDNLTRSIRWTGKIILDLVPNIYDAERVMRIIGEDGKPEIVTINQRTTDEFGVETVLNDVTIGQYDVVMETGPGYNTKRQEAVDSMMSLLAADPNLMNQAGDLIFRNMDFPGADIIADRLAAVNPMAQIDEKSPVPPQVQMQLAANQQQMQAMQKQIEVMSMVMKYRTDVEAVRQTGEDRRAVIAAEVKMRDQNTRSLTSQNKTEIEALMKLILGQIDTSRLEAEIMTRNQEQYAMMDRATNAIEDNMAVMAPNPEQIRQEQQMAQQAEQMPQGQPQQPPQQMM